MTSQPTFQPMGGDAAYQWTGSEDVPQVQTQYGYNYHHIDQRTEHHSGPATCMSPKPSGQQQTGEVYAEFTCEPEYYEPSESIAYSSGEYLVQSTYEGDSSHYHQAEGQGQYQSEHAQFGSDQQFYTSSDMHTARGDHARYVSDGYVHFLFSRQSQQGDSTDMGSREDPEEMDNREDPPSPTDASLGSGQRRKLSAPPLNVSLEHSEGSLLSEDTEEETGDELDLNIEDMDTPDEADSVDFDAQRETYEAAAASGPGTQSEPSREGKLWRSVVIGEQEHRIDMKCIEPYKRVLSHGGYYEEQHAIIVFAACFLPDSDCNNYNYVMENLFLYVISTLELMVAEDYMIVYLNGATPHRRMPGFIWMKKCYQMIDRRLKKNLKMFIIVHPSWFIRTLLGITRPFISSKFSSKIKYVHSLHDLGQIIPMEYVHIPPSIIRLDSELQETTCKSDRKRSSAV